MRECWNWQTGKTKDLVHVFACGFKSHFPHIEKETEWFPFFVSANIFEMCLHKKVRTEKIIFSHDTALFLHGLSERTPFEHSVTIPSNSVLSDAMMEECICYYVKPELYEVGVMKKKTTFGNEVRCYDVERTICDVLRSRNRMDEETVISAIKNYVGVVS